MLKTRNVSIVFLFGFSVISFISFISLVSVNFSYFHL